MPSKEEWDELQKDLAEQEAERKMRESGPRARAARAKERLLRFAEEERKARESRIDFNKKPYIRAGEILASAVYKEPIKFEGKGITLQGVVTKENALAKALNEKLGDKSYTYRTSKGRQK